MDKGQFTAEERIKIDKAASVDVGAVIRERRKKKNYRLNEFAALIGISGAQMSRIESSTGRASRETLSRISSYLGIPYSDLVMWSGYSAIKADRRWFNRDGEVIDADAAVRNIYAADSQLLDDLSRNTAIASPENSRVLRIVIQNMAKEEESNESQDPGSLQRRKAFRALKDFIVSALE